MIRANAIALVLLAPLAAPAQIVFEPEEPSNGGITFEPEDPADSGITFEPESPAEGSITFEAEEDPPSGGISFETAHAEETRPAPADPEEPPEAGWTAPVVSFDLASRLGHDTRFDRGGEMAGYLLHRARTGVLLRHGDWTLKIEARLRWLTTGEAPRRGPFLAYNAVNRRSVFEPLWGESHIGIRRFGIEWTAGWQELAWGQNAAFAAADVLNPVDLRDGPSSLQPKLPVPMLRARGSLGGLRWDAVWMPFFVASRFPLLGNDWSPLHAQTAWPFGDPSRALDPTTHGRLEPNLVATRYPHDDLTASQGGLRLSGRAGPFDLAFTWAETFDRTPRTSLSPAARRFNEALRRGDREGMEMAGAEVLLRMQGGQSPYNAEFVRTRTLAFDTAVLTGAVRWTLDLGLSPARVFPTAELESVVQPVLQTTLGFEWDGPLLVAAGLNSLSIFGVPEGTRLLFLERAGADSPNREVNLTIAYATAMYTGLGGRLRIALATLATVQMQDLFALPYLEWKFSDAQGLGIGAHLLTGRVPGFGGVFRRNNEVFAQYSLSL